MKKKKQTEPKTAVRRLQAIISIMGLMVAFILIIRMNRTEKAVPPVGPVETKMDIQLDSILRHDFPEGTKILEKKEIEYLTLASNLETQLNATRERYERIATSAEPDTLMLKKLKKKIKQQQGKLKKGRSTNGYFRHVTIKYPTGQRMVCYQNMFEDMSQSVMIMKLDIDNRKIPEEIQNDIDKTNNQN